MASLLWDFGLLDMGLRVWVEKVMLMLHIRRLGDETLACKVYKEQKLKEWPGLVKETDMICSELSVQSVHSTKLSAKVYRCEVLKACHKVNEQRLRKLAEGKTKCAKIEAESYGKKNYISDSKIQHMRETYKARFGMMPFAGNYQRDQRFFAHGMAVSLRRVRGGAAPHVGELRGLRGDQVCVHKPE